MNKSVDEIGGWLSVYQAVNEKFKSVRRDSDCWIIHNTEGVLNNV